MGNAPVGGGCKPRVRSLNLLPTPTPRCRLLHPLHPQCSTLRAAAAAQRTTAAPKRTGGVAARLPACRPAVRSLRSQAAAADAQYLTACPPAVGQLSKEERDELAKQFGFR